ncbi:MAG: carboxymuconolactone decarboxylase family protein [Novosphingobium sp.]|uniref:carboxymuconolactone decarboxylase family protein n=1 Tax=Novosphingobium sp. TaxID=1874826 RepID=UPI003019F31C
MTRYNVHTIETAPEASQPLLAGVKRGWGFIPKLQGTLAESPLALEAYDTLFNLVAAKATLTPAEQQVVYQAINVYHGCEYCTAGHTFLSRKAGVPEDVIQAIRDRAPIADTRLEALRRFAEVVAETRGFAGDSAVDAFIAAGFTKAQVLEVVTIIATKVMSNYTNHLTHTPLEDFMADPALRWIDPLGRTARDPALVAA